MNTGIPTDRKKFMLCKENKQQLIDLFSLSLEGDGMNVKHAINEMPMF